MTVLNFTGGERRTDGGGHGEEQQSTAGPIQARGKGGPRRARGKTGRQGGRDEGGGRGWTGLPDKPGPARRTWEGLKMRTSPVPLRAEHIAAVICAKRRLTYSVWHPVTPWLERFGGEVRQDRGIKSRTSSRNSGGRMPSMGTFCSSREIRPRRCSRYPCARRWKQQTNGSDKSTSFSKN